MCDESAVLQVVHAFHKSHLSAANFFCPKLITDNNNNNN